MTTVADLMRKKTVVCGPSDRIRTVALQMAEQGIDYLPVCDGDRLVGVITPRDLMLSGTVGKKSRITVKKVMDRRPSQVSPDTPAEKALRLMGRRRIPWLSVVEEGQLIGIVGLGDLARAEGMVHRVTRALERSSHPRPVRNRRSRWAPGLAAGLLIAGGWALWTTVARGRSD